MGLRAIFLFLVFFFQSTLHAQTEDAPIAKIDDHLIYTVTQFEKTLIQNLSILSPKITKSSLLVNDNGVEKPEMLVHIDGIISGYKVTQTLTYLQHPKGLWRLTKVQGKLCVRGEALRGGEWVKDWFCEDLFYPYSKHVAHIYLLENESVDLKQLSLQLGKQVVPYAPPQQTQEPKMPSLGDLHAWFMSQGSDWTEETRQWRPFSQPDAPTVPALVITVRADMGHRSYIKQSFLYIYVDDELHLKEISGKYCKYIERMQKDICEDVYEPTSHTPFPLKLKNTRAQLGHFRKGKNSAPQEKSSHQLTCGQIAGIHQQMSQFHFERGMFTAFDTKEMKRALLALPLVIDPQQMIFDAHDSNLFNLENLKQTFNLSPEILEQEMQKGRDGNCEAFIDLAERVKLLVLNTSSTLAELTSLATQVNFDLTLFERQISSLSPQAQELWARLAVLPNFDAHNLPSSFSIKLSQFQYYLKDTLDLASDPERLAIALFVRHDSYSQLLSPTQSQSLQSTVNGSVQRKYFGLSMVSGIKNHWINFVHPKIAATASIVKGDEVIRINGQLASELSASELDSHLLKTDQPLALELKRDGKVLSVTVTSSALNPVDMSYKLEKLSSEQNSPWVLRLSSFESGLVEVLRPQLLAADGIYENGLVIDLRGNPGGNAQEAVKLLSFFIKDQPVGYFRLGSRGAAPLQALTPTPEYFVSENLPLAVLIDRNSMSASEIFASAIQDLGRGLIIGEKSYGKLVGQNLFSLPRQLSANQNDILDFVVTTTEYFSPNGKSLNQIGIQPDVFVGDSSQPREKVEDGISPGKDVVPPTPVKRYQLPDLMSAKLGLVD